MKGLKSLGCLLALLLAAIILLPSKAMAADVAINSTNFPDAKFREYVKKFDKNSDGKFSESELEAVISMDVSKMGISSLKGLEYFTKIEDIDCTGNSISTLDLSKNPYLVIAYENPDYIGDVDCGTFYDYQYSVIPDDWDDDDDCDPDPCGWYELIFDKTTKITIKTPCIYEQTKRAKFGTGKTGKFSLWAACDSTLTYQWQYKKPGATGWTNVTSASGKTAVYSLTVAERHDGYTYRCKVTSASGDFVYSDEVLLTVVPKPTIKTQPKDVTVKGVGTKATIKVVASGEGLKYTWYVSDPADNGKFFKSSVKTASYSASLTKEKNGRKAYVVVTDKYGNSVTSKTVTMDYVTAKPKITSPTAATTKKVAKGKIATFTVKAKQGKTYQWQYRTSKTGTWKNVSAASGKTASYKLTVAKKHNGYQYRCKVTNPYGSVYSKIFTLKVTS